MADLVHVLLDDGRGRGVILVDCLAALEVDVGILLADLDHRPLGTEGQAAELLEVLRFEERGKGLVRDEVDLLDLARGPEAVEEMKERNSGFERGQMGDDGQVLGFLDRAGASHGESRVPGGHDVAVVAEDRE